jgi:hypothetical protein
LAIVAAGLVALGTLALLSFGKVWPLAAFSSPPHTDTADQEVRPSAKTDDGAAAEAFDRILIRNIATVPFVELFDLLRSAPAKTRDAWVKQLDEMPDGPKRNAALSSFYKTLVQIDPHAAAESAANLHGEYGRYLAIEATIGAAPLSALEEMANLLIKLPPKTLWGSRRSHWEDVFYDWSAVDPVAVAQFIEEHPDTSADRSETLLSNWARVDPDAAKAWMERQPVALQTEDAIEGLVGGWFDRDEANALAFVVAHASEGTFKRAIDDLANNLFQRSPDEARTFLLRLPNEARGAAISQIVSITTGVVLGRPENWERQPEEMAKWILTLPQESWGEAMQEVLGNWGDENGIAGWINQLPVETRDQVAADYCSMNSLGHPEQAIVIGLSITDATLREQSLRKLMNQWPLNSPEEAHALLEEIPLSDAQRKYLTSLLPTE